jgi:hypothetical protein
MNKPGANRKDDLPCSLCGVGENSSACIELCVRGVVVDLACSVCLAIQRLPCAMLEPIAVISCRLRCQGDVEG